MDVDEEEIEMPTSSGSKGEKKRFEVKKVRIETSFMFRGNLIPHLTFLLKKISTALFATAFQCVVKLRHSDKTVFNYLSQLG
jgi:hypothetical protein